MITTLSSNQAQLPQCQQPLNPNVTTITHTTATVNWVSPGGIGGTVVCGFQLSYRPIGGAWSPTVSLPANTTTYGLTGLTPLTTYAVRIRTNCCSSFNSNYVNTTFTTLVSEGDCEKTPLILTPSQTMACIGQQLTLTVNEPWNVVRWERSVDGTCTNWDPIGGTNRTLNTTIPNTQLSNVCYRVVVSLPGCPEKTSDPVIILITDTEIPLLTHQNPPFLANKGNVLSVSTLSPAISFRWFLRNTPNVTLSTTQTCTVNQPFYQMNDHICAEVIFQEGCRPVRVCSSVSELMPTCDGTCGNITPRNSAVLVDNITLTNLASVLNSPVNLTNQQVWVSGTLTIDVANPTLTGCRFVMLPNASVVVNANCNPIIRGTDFVGCNGRWQGISLTNPSTWNSDVNGNNRPLICYAERGISFGGNSLTSLRNTDFNQNQTGLYGLNPTTNLVLPGFTVQGCFFRNGDIGLYIDDTRGGFNQPVAYPNITIGDNSNFNNFEDVGDGIRINTARSSTTANTVQIRWNAFNCRTQTSMRYPIEVTNNQNSDNSLPMRSTIITLNNRPLC